MVRQDRANVVALTNVVLLQFYMTQRLHLSVSLAFVYELLIRKILI